MFHKIFFAVAVVGVFVSIFFIVQAVRTETSSSTAFAACLSEQQVTMYGVDTCSQCKNQKKIFGDALQEINYVNCAFHADECNALPSSGYPTWTMRGTVIAQGFQTFAELSALTGCSY